MRLPDPSRRPAPEPLLALVNVIFLLLVFVLLVAELAPPDPVSVTPPRAAAGPGEGGRVVLHVGADGVPWLADAAGDAALAALAAACGPAGCTDPVVLRADAAMQAAALAALLPRLAAAGAGRVEIVTVPR